MYSNLSYKDRGKFPQFEVGLKRGTYIFITKWMHWFKYTIQEGGLSAPLCTGGIVTATSPQEGVN